MAAPVSRLGSRIADVCSILAAGDPLVVELPRARSGPPAGRLRPGQAALTAALPQAQP
jgi:hypothetical protein